MDFPMDFPMKSVVERENLQESLDFPMKDGKNTVFYF